MVTIPVSPETRSRLQLENIEDGETRCIIIKGSCKDAADGHITVEAKWLSGEAQFPTQTWPVAQGRFKLLAMLSPGPNRLIIRLGEDPAGSQAGDLKLDLTYTPLLDTPPLHLAIMVGKDSPLLIDCPPSKHAGVSSAHASLDAAIAKFRMTAYMWQALTAEDMYTKQLGRRSFRLDEAWAPDTTSASFLDTAHGAGAMRATARIHLVPSEHTVQEIRDADLAQQNERARRRHGLHAWFADALRAHARTNPALARSARPVVAGLILDAHYSDSRGLILGHAALGVHDPAGLSLGIMGSHLTHAWPRFLEEVTACLLDARAPGEGFVGNDNGECGTLWEACAVGQGAFLHEVGHAFGAPHTSGIMARGYAVHWPRNFVARTAWGARDREEGILVDDEENEASWDLRDALKFALLPHFWIPDDGRRPKMSPETRAAAPGVVALFDGDEEYGLHGTVLKITSASRIATIQWNDMDRLCLVAVPMSAMLATEKELEAQYSREEPLRLTVIGMNGKERTVRDVWRLLSDRFVVRIPGAGFALQKRSVMTKLLETEDEAMQKKQFWHWATLLHRRKDNGKLTRARRVDVRTGCILDGAYVYYADQTRVNCGPRFSYPGRKHKHTFGGHQSEEIVIPEDQEIVKIEVSREEYVLGGMRIHLSNGDSGGQLNADNGTETLILDVAENERVVGFYGRSYWGECFDGLVEFGILTAPKEVELPEVVYTMTELQNIDGGVEFKEEESEDEGCHRRCRRRSSSVTEREDEDEDEDEGGDE